MRPQLTYANVVATLALFLAISTGGAFAASKVIDGRTIRAGSVKTKQLGSSAVTSAKVKNGSLTAADFRKGTLKAGPAGPAGGAGAVGPVGPAGAPGAAAALSASSVGTAELKADAVTGAKIADGTLNARDVARFAGTLQLSFGAIGAGGCVATDSTGLTPIVAGESLADDAIVITPPESLSPNVVLNARPKGANQITVVACNVSGGTVTPGVLTLRYLTFDAAAG